MRYSIKDLIEEVERDLAERAEYYKSLIASNKITRGEAIVLYRKMQAIKVVLQTCGFDNIELKEKK